MAVTKGFLTVAGYKKAATWGTPILVAANNGIEILSESISSDYQLVPNEGISGSAQQRKGDLGNEFHRGDLVVPAKYETLTTLLALGQGTAGAPVQQGADIAYKHALKIKNETDGLFGTLALDYQLEVHEYPSFKVDGWDFEIDAASQVGKFTFHLVCDALNRNTGAGTNKTSTISGITMAANRSRLLFQNMTVRMNDASGAGLGAGDKQFITSLKISMSRSHKGDDVTTQRGRFIDEPMQDGWTMPRLTLGFSKYATDNIGRFADNAAKTAKKADIVFAGPLCNGATNYNFAFYLNDLQVPNSAGRPNIGGAGLTAFTLDFEPHAVAAIPTGFPTGYTDALDIDLINGLSTDALA